MKAKLINWFKTHRRARAMIPTIIALTLILATIIPVYADWSLAYPDVTGTYLVGGNASPVELDGTYHPRVKFNRLIITTQTGKVISVATLEHMGTNIALTGLVGPGTRSSIVLGGTDSDGTVVAIQGRVVLNRDGDVVSINGRMMGYVTSDGSRWEDSADGTTATSVVAYHSQPLSTKLVAASAVAGPVTQLFHNPVSRVKLSQLSSLREGQLGFWFNLEAATTIGPAMMLRFAPENRSTYTNQSYWGGAGTAYVDITVMPYQSPYAGTGAWVECDLAVDAATIVYYGNDPTDYTSFGGTPVSGIENVEAAINAEVAMTAGGDSASNWVLTMADVELYEAGDRDCYVDDVTIGGITYELEPNSYFANFKAVLLP